MVSGGLSNARKPIAPSSVRPGLGADAIATALIENLDCLQRKPPQHATRNDWYMALAYALRDCIMERYVATLESIARRISDGKAVPAADLSEQISMAGNEASGTGNLKFALDRGNHNRDVGQRQRRDPGRRGTLSGLTAEELTRRKAEDYTPRNESRAARGDRPHQFRILFERGSRTVLAARRSLLSRDDHMLVADCQDYVECQERVNQAYADCNAWTRMFIFNCARVGRFSSDRSIREYCRDICKVTPIIFDEGRAGCGP